MYLSRYSVDKIMKELASESMMSLKVKEKWFEGTIQKMFTNEKYIGNVMLGKTYTGTYLNNKQKVNKGEQEQFIIQDAHEPIISIEIFEQVQEEIKRRSNIEMVDRKAKRGRTHYSSKKREGNIEI